MTGIIGTIILAFSIIAAAFYVASVVNKRVKLLECCITLIKNISVDIAYCSETVFMIINKAAQSKELKELKFLEEMSNCTDVDFSICWSDAVDTFLLQSALNKADADLLKSFGNKLGTTDSHHQTQLCEEYIKRFEERYENEKSKLAERIRLCKVCGGVFALIALVLLI